MLPEGRTDLVLILSAMEMEMEMAMATAMATAVDYAETKILENMVMLSLVQFSLLISYSTSLCVDTAPGPYFCTRVDNSLAHSACL